MKIGNVVFWVDSMVVYHWVRNDRNRYMPFVTNRLAEIHEHLGEMKQLDCREKTPRPVKVAQAALHPNRLQFRAAAFPDTGMDHFGPS